MTDKARDLRREYLREWRKNNKSKTREYALRYWEKKAKEGVTANEVLR